MILAGSALSSFLLAATGRTFVLAAGVAFFRPFGTTFVRCLYFTTAFAQLGFGFGSASRKECKAERGNGDDKYFLHKIKS
jgi:hypothetical protein